MYAFVSDDSREYSRVGTQVATFSVYAYFLAALFGRQFLEPRGEHRWAQNTLVPWKWQNEIIDNCGPISGTYNKLEMFQHSQFSFYFFT